MLLACAVLVMAMPVSVSSSAFGFGAGRRSPAEWSTFRVQLSLVSAVGAGWSGPCIDRISGLSLFQAVLFLILFSYQTASPNVVPLRRRRRPFLRWQHGHALHWRPPGAHSSSSAQSRSGPVVVAVGQRRPAFFSGFYVASSDFAAGISGGAFYTRCSAAPRLPFVNELFLRWCFDLLEVFLFDHGHHAGVLVAFKNHELSSRLIMQYLGWYWCGFGGSWTRPMLAGACQSVYFI